MFLGLAQLHQLRGRVGRGHIASRLPKMARLALMMRRHILGLAISIVPKSCMKPMARKLRWQFVGRLVNILA